MKTIECNKILLGLSLLLLVSTKLHSQSMDNNGNGANNGIKNIKNLKSSTCILKVIPSPTNLTSSMAYDGQFLWIGAALENLIYKIDTSGNVLDTLFTSIDRPYGLAFQNSDLWISDRENHILQKIDTSSGAILSTISTPDNTGWPSGIAWDGTNLWYNESLYDTTYVLDTTGLIIEKHPSYGADPIALTFQNNYLWSSNTIVGEIYKIDTVNFLAVDTIIAPGGIYPSGLAFDGVYLWVASNSSDSIYKLCADHVTGIVEINNEALITVYPNPTIKTISISLDATYERLKVIQRNIIGQSINEQDFRNTNLVNMEIKGVDKIYFIEIQTGGRLLKTFKILKK